MAARDEARSIWSPEESEHRRLYDPADAHLGSNKLNPSQEYGCTAEMDADAWLVLDLRQQQDTTSGLGLAHKRSTDDPKQRDELAHHDEMGTGAGAQAGLNHSHIPTTAAPPTVSEQAAAEAEVESAAAESVHDESVPQNKTHPKRKVRTEEDQIAYVRERNKHHAKATRERKKAYVANLEKTLEDMVASRKHDARKIFEREAAEHAIADQRKSCLERFLHYRHSGVTDRSSWTMIVDEASFTLSVPITPYRSFNRSEVVGDRRVMVGLESLLRDVCSLQVFVQDIGGDSAAQRCDMEVESKSAVIECVCDKSSMMAQWRWRSLNAMARGAKCEISLSGMARAQFDQSQRMTSVVLVWDVMALMQQLKLSVSLSAEMPIIPNTIQMAQAGRSDEARVITKFAPGFPIVDVNAPWERLCGYSLAEVKGKSLSIMQGPATSQVEVDKLMHEVRQFRAASMKVQNYRRDGRLFGNHVRVYPLSDDGRRITHILGVLREIPLSCATSSPSPTSSSASASTKERVSAYTFVG